MVQWSNGRHRIHVTASTASPARRPSSFSLAAKAPQCLTVQWMPESRCSDVFKCFEDVCLFLHSIDSIKMNYNLESKARPLSSYPFYFQCPTTLPAHARSI